MRLTSTLIALILLSIAIHSATAARATSLLDGIESALLEVVAFESGQATPDKRRLKTAQKVVKRLGKDTSAPIDDVKLLKAVIAATAKRFAEDATVVAATSSALAAVDGDVDAVITEARALIAGAANKRVSKADKAAKLADAAQAKLEQARAATTSKIRVGKLLAARKKADKALKLAETLPPGGGEDEFLGPDPIARFAYFSLDEQKNILQTINLRTKERRTLSDGTGLLEIRSPAPLQSADGSLIAFREGQKLRVTDGSNVVTMPLDADWDNFAFSPDGALLAATDTDTPLFAVFDVSGAVLVNQAVVVSGRFGDNSFVWAADSSAVAVRADVGGDSTGEVRVYDGEGLADVRDVQGAAPFETRIRRLAWSEDGQRLIYLETKLGSNRDGELVVVNRAGTQRATVSLPGVDAVGVGGEYFEERGGTIVYLGDVGGQRQLASVGVDGTGHTVFDTADQMSEIHFVQSGRSVLRIADGVLVTSDPDGGNLVTLSTAPTDVSVAADGSEVVFRAGPLPGPGKDGDAPEGSVISSATDGSSSLSLHDPGSGGLKAVQVLTQRGVGRTSPTLASISLFETEEGGLHLGGTESDREAPRQVVLFDTASLRVLKEFGKRILTTGRLISSSVALLESSSGQFVIRQTYVLEDSESGKFYVCTEDGDVSRSDGRLRVDGTRTRGACEEISSFQAAFLGSVSGFSQE